MEISQLRILNYNMIKDDVAEIYEVYRKLISEIESAILALGWFQYFVLVCIESDKYLNDNLNINIRGNLKNKKTIENCRARMKPYECDYEELCNQMNEINFQKKNEFDNMVKKLYRKILEKWIPNYGVYICDNKIIGNTFLYESLYKKTIYKDGKVSREKIIEVSTEIGNNIKTLISILKIKSKEEKISNKNIEISCKDYNVFSDNNRLLRNGIEKNYGLLLLNAISLMNFYDKIIKRMVTREELRYRIGFIIFSGTYSNILKICRNNNEIILKLAKYEKIHKRDFRNCMFHYDISKVLGDDEIKDEMYYGIISKLLNLNEYQYKCYIDDYMIEISNALEKLILR